MEWTGTLTGITMEAEGETEGSSVCEEKKKKTPKKAAMPRHLLYHKAPQGAAFNTLSILMRGADLARTRRSDAAVGTHVSI